MMKKTLVCPMILMATLPILSGCHHLQLARNPLPILLYDENPTPTISSNAFVIDTEKPSGKNKPNKRPKPPQLVRWF